MGPPGSQSMENGIDATFVITSGPPSGSSACTVWSTQSENHSRPSCQRGDSPSPSPPVKTVGSGALIAISRSRLAGARVPQRAGGGESLARLEQRLEAREDHRPAAVQLRVGALRELVVDHRQPTGVIADRLDLPGDPRRPSGLHIVAPERIEA